MPSPPRRLRATAPIDTSPDRLATTKEPRTMQVNRPRAMIGLIAALGATSLVTSGCQPPAGESTARGAPADAPRVAGVAAAKPERATVRRVTEVPGQT